MERKHKLPSFLIIGIAKCGTTSLYNTLIQHPKIQPALRKELYFFNKPSKYKKHLRYYKKLFNPCDKDEITGEASPNYIWIREAIQRIKKSLPKVKIIVLLRNPVDRCQSAWYGYLRKCKGKKEKPLAKSFEKFLEIIEKKPGINRNHRGHNIVEKGIYVTQIKRLFKYFSQEQIMIIKSEDFFKYSNTVSNAIFKFLGLKKYKIKPLHRLIGTQQNKQSEISYSPLSKKCKKKLYKFYKYYNEKLYKLIERDMKWETYQPS